MVGERLAELRERKALTLHELQELSGVGADAISKIENGHRKPRPSTLRKLARALGVGVEDFFREPAVPLVDAPPEVAGHTPEERAEIASAMARGIEDVSNAYRRTLEQLTKGGASPDELFTLHLQASSSLIGIQGIVDGASYAGYASVHEALEHLRKTADEILRATTRAEQAPPLWFADYQKQKASQSA